MLNISIAQLKSDIAGKMKGTSIKEIKDFNGTAASAANRMLARIDTEETRRTVTMATPFYDNVQDYALVTDYKRMIDIRPTANRKSQPGRSHFSQTDARQFNERLTPDSFSIRWNNMMRSIRAQRLPGGGVVKMDSFDGTVSAGIFTSNGAWSAFGDISNLAVEVLNYVEGNGSLRMDLSGVSGTGYIENSTAAVMDLSQLYYEDASVLFYYIPVGFSSKFINFKLRRGSSSTNYVEQTVTTKADGTAFSYGWNMLIFYWATASTTGAPDNTNNTYRRFTAGTVTGTAIKGCLIDNWTNSLGNLYEIEYYSECLFRDLTGSIWKYAPTVDSDLLNVSSSSYEIFKTEMMIEITQQTKTGKVLDELLTDYRLMLNGQPESRYVKDPPYHGYYADYLKAYPSSAIVTITKTYDFDL